VYWYSTNKLDAQHEPALHSVVLDSCHYITRAKVCLLSVIQPNVHAVRLACHPM